MSEHEPRHPAGEPEAEVVDLTTRLLDKINDPNTPEREKLHVVASALNDRDVFKWSPSMVGGDPKGDNWINIDHPDIKRFMPAGWREQYFLDLRSRSKENTSPNNE